MTTTRARRRGSAVAVALGLAVAGLAAPAAATTQAATPLEWEVSTGEGVLIDGPIFGRPILAPGDSGERIVTIRNGGPTTGTLVVSIINAEASAEVPDTFHDDLVVNGVIASDLVGETTIIHSSDLEPGDSIAVPIWFEFPSESTAGNRAIVGEQTFSFDVHLNLSGELPATPDVEEPADTPGEDSAVTPPATDTDSQAGDTGTLPSTGWALSAGTVVLAAFAAAATALGIFLRTIGRRRRNAAT